MAALEFKGYQSFEHFSLETDAYRSKWQAMRLPPPDLAQVPTTLLEFASITAMNVKTNDRIRYVAEAPGVDIWQPPAVTLAKGTGDCEDIAILKYSALLKSGMPEDRLRLVIGEIANDPVNIPHAWCAVCLPEQMPNAPLLIRNKWWALDNKFDHLADAVSYINWVPKAAMWGDKVVRYGRVTSVEEVLDKLTRDVV